MNKYTTGHQLNRGHARIMQRKSDLEGLNIAREQKKPVKILIKSYNK